MEQNNMIEPVLLGYETSLGSTDNVELTEDKVFEFLMQTKQQIENNKAAFESIQNPDDMLNMYNYAIEHWYKDSRDEALEVLAQKEKELIKQGKIDLDGETEGVFSNLRNVFAWEEDASFDGLGQTEEDPNYTYEYYYENEIDDTLDGLFSKIKSKLKNVKKNVVKRRKKRITARKERREERKENRAERKVKRRKVFKKVVSKINKVNPATLAARNAFRALVALNLFGLATILSSNNAKARSVLSKVKNHYKLMGGNVSKLLQSIERGKRKKPLMNKEAKNAWKKNKVEGLGSFTVAGLIASAGAVLAKVWSWIKDAGISVGKVAKKGVEKIKDKREENKENRIVRRNERKERREEEGSFIERGIDKFNDLTDRFSPQKITTKPVVSPRPVTQTGKTNDNYISSDTEETDSKEKTKKILGISVGVIAVGTAAYLGYRQLNKQQPNQLEGIELK
jgi:hypothetical protein